MSPVATLRSYDRGSRIPYKERHQGNRTDGSKNGKRGRRARERERGRDREFKDDGGRNSGRRGVIH